MNPTPPKSASLLHAQPCSLHDRHRFLPPSHRHLRSAPVNIFYLHPEPALAAQYL